MKVDIRRSQDQEVTALDDAAIVALAGGLGALVILAVMVSQARGQPEELRLLGIFAFALVAPVVLIVLDIVAQVRAATRPGQAKYEIVHDVLPPSQRETR